MQEISESDLESAVATGTDLDRLRGESPILVVHRATGHVGPRHRVVGPARGIVVVAIDGERGTRPTDNVDEPWGAEADILLGGDAAGALAQLTDAIEHAPQASVALVELLRLTERLPPDLGLIAESATYSMLQAGPEHARWLDRRWVRRGGDRESISPPTDGEPTVRVERDDNSLTVTLWRPERHNAYSSTMRDALVEALELALVDTSIRAVILRGAGPSWCSGGDLDEFGTRPDPAAANRVRLDRSAAALLWRLRDRVSVEIHGAAIGAGIELAAVAARVVAAPDVQISLPEVALGLVPGSGGTISVVRRIGRRRTAWLGLTGAVLDAETALAWGLVDAIDPAIGTTASRAIAGGRSDPARR